MQRIFIHSAFDTGEPWSAETVSPAHAGLHYGTTETLVGLLELHLGIERKKTNRILDQAHLCEEIESLIASGRPYPFTQTFADDPFAITEYLLDIHEQLRMAGWNGKTAVLPERIRSLLTVFNDGVTVAPALSERIIEVIARLDKTQALFDRIVRSDKVCTVLEQRLFSALESPECTVEDIQEQTPEILASNDLGLLKAALTGQIIPPDAKFAKDGSCLYIRTDTEYEAAEACAALSKKDTSGTLLCRSGESETLSAVLRRQTGQTLDTRGTKLHSSLYQFFPLYLNALDTRPSVQQLYEYLSLPLSPLPGVRRDLADKMKRNPGTGGESWDAAIKKYLESGSASASAAERIETFLPDEDAKHDHNAIPKEVVVRALTLFGSWLGSMTGLAKKKDDQAALAYYSGVRSYIESLLEYFAQTGKTVFDRHFLNELSQRIAEETAASASSVSSRDALRQIESSSLILSPVRTLFWWNFTLGDRTVPVSPFTAGETAQLEQRGIHIPDPKQTTDAIRRGWERSLLHAGRVLFFSWHGPDENKEHPLWSILAGKLEDRNMETICLSSVDVLQTFGDECALPPIAFTAEPDWTIDPGALPVPDEIHITGIETLLRCPVRFLLENSRIRESLPQPGALPTSEGNAAHMVIETRLRQTFDNQKNPATADELINQALREKCAYLNERGNEAQKERFKASVKGSLEKLEKLIAQNAVTGFSAEQELTGTLDGLKLKGRYDLLFQGADRDLVLDMKYSRGGRAKYDQTIRDNLGFQPAAYAHLLSSAQKNPVDAGYFSIVHAAASVYGDESAWKELKASGGAAASTVDSFMSGARRIAGDLKRGHAHLDGLEARTSDSKNKKDRTAFDEETGETKTSLLPKCEYCPYPAFCGKYILSEENDNEQGD